MKQSFLVFLVLIVSAATAYSQTANLALKLGGNLEDNSHRVISDNAGNIIVTGRFHGTADFDPGSATFNLTSNGSNDMFIAKYSSTGAFIWAFKVGGPDRDAAYSAVVDGQDNIYVTGYFRAIADFDPGAGTANLISNGDSGFIPGWE